MRKCGYMEADREDLDGYECETGKGYGGKQVCQIMMKMNSRKSWTLRTHPIMIARRSIQIRKTQMRQRAGSIAISAADPSL